MIDIINAHATEWKNISLVTGKLVQRDIALHSKVAFKKIITYRRGSAFKRVLTWGIGFLQILWLVKTKYKTAHLYLVSNPPFTAFLPFFCSNSYSLLLFDVYPDALLEYSVFKKNSFWINVWSKSNKKAYPQASDIFVLSNGMKKLVSQYVEESRVKVTPLWTHNEYIKPVDKTDNPFIVKHHLQDKFLVVYSGNLGRTHNLETLIKVASMMKNDNIVFLIIGEGEKKDALQELINDLHILNCMLLPWQEISMLPYSMAAADIGVISLGKEASLLSVPSKTYNLLSAGVPLLCIADERSELAELVGQKECGKCFDDQSIEEIMTFIERVATDGVYRKALQVKSLQASLSFDSSNARNMVAS
ncbi:MAG: glycosyltransferase family 4 protein [Cyclobacteriaceae bacterium]|nr:glycosyltransferase family 4 protein [Cyclobacteriaceae bacterium]